MTVFRPPNSKRFVYKFMIKGVLYRGPTGHTNERDAKAVEKAAKAEVKKKLLLAPPDDTSAMTVGQAIERYLEWRDAQPSASPRLLHGQVKDYSKLAHWLGPNTLMSTVSTADLQLKVIDRRMAEPRRNSKGEPVKRRDPVTGEMVSQRLTGGTINRTTWQLFKPVHMKCRDVWGVAVKPIDWTSLRMKETGERRRVIRFEEEARFSEFFRDGYGDLFQFHLVSGLRKSNCIGLLWTQVDLVSGEIQVRQKGGRVHTIRIDDAMRTILLEQRGRHPIQVFTFVAQRTYRNARAGADFEAGKRYPVKAEGFTSWFNRVRAKIGSPDLRIHDLRRAAGSRMLSATNNLKAVQQLLGHGDISTTAKHYAHVLGDDQVALQNLRNERDAKMRAALAAKPSEVTTEIGQVIGQASRE